MSVSGFNHWLIDLSLLSVSLCLGFWHKVLYTLIYSFFPQTKHINQNFPLQLSYRTVFGCKWAERIQLPNDPIYSKPGHPHYYNITIISPLCFSRLFNLFPVEVDLYSSMMIWLEVITISTQNWPATLSQKHHRYWIEISLHFLQSWIWYCKIAADRLLLLVLTEDYYQPGHPQTSLFTVEWILEVVLSSLSCRQTQWSNIYS